MIVSKRVPRAGFAAAALALAVLPASALPSKAAGGRSSHTLTVHHHRYGREAPAAEPVLIPLDGSGVFINTPFVAVSSPSGPDALVRLPHYQGPDGAYDDPADRWNAINGVPCGRECTDRALARWGYRPAD